jgi:very-short-patch-repair endonuclease
MPEEIVEVTALRHRRRRNLAVIWHESHHLTERDITAIDGLPVTRPARTFLDLGVVLSPDELEVVLNEGIRRKLLSVDAIARRLEELGSLRRGTAVVRTVLGRYVPGRRAPESVLETRFVQLVRSARLPQPVPQFQVRLEEGSLARLDFAYPRHMVGIELDGEAYHAGQLARRRDRRRDMRLGALGWRVLHFDWDDVTRSPEYVCQTIDAYLDRNNSG